MLRIAYGPGAVCFVGMAMLAGSGTLTSLVLQAGEGAPVPPEFGLMLRTVDYSVVVFGLVLAGVFGFLARRPYGWGKLLCAWAG